MVWVTWYKHKCTTPVPTYLGLSYLNMTKVEKNRVIQIDIIHFENKIIWAEMGDAPLITDTLFWFGTNIQWLWDGLKPRYSILILMLSEQLAEHGDIHCWYVEIQQWFKSHGININAPPHLNMNKLEKNKSDPNWYYQIEKQNNMHQPHDISW